METGKFSVFCRSLGRQVSLRKSIRYSKHWALAKGALTYLSLNGMNIPYIITVEIRSHGDLQSGVHIGNFNMASLGNPKLGI